MVRKLVRDSAQVALMAIGIFAIFYGAVYIHAVNQDAKNQEQIAGQIVKAAQYEFWKTGRADYCVKGFSAE